MKKIHKYVFSIFFGLALFIISPPKVQGICYNDFQSPDSFNNCTNQVGDGIHQICKDTDDPTMTWCCNNENDSCPPKKPTPNPNASPTPYPTGEGYWKNLCGPNEKCLDGLKCIMMSDGIKRCCVDGDTSCTLPPGSKIGDVPIFDLCKRLPDPARSECISCLGSDDRNRGVYTALGCIHTAPTYFIVDFMKIALGIAGGIALLLMIYGAFLISISAGDPKKAEEGREYITGTIAGLLFIIFSSFLLKLIGIDILQIPGT